MADVLSRKKRSQVMAAVRSERNKATELRLVSIFRAYGIKGWRRQQPLMGKPDFLFPKERVVVFVDGCFWHGCPIHGECPASNRDYWRNKLARNRARDRGVNRLLRQRNWRVVRLWEHGLRNPERVALKVRAALQGNRVKTGTLRR